MTAGSKYISIGKFAGTHGLKGDLVLKHGLGKKTDLKGLTTLFIKQKTGSYLPWFVTSCKAKNEEELFIKLEEVDSKEAATALINKEVWFTENDFEKFAAKGAALSLLGFTIYDHQQPVGSIEEVIEMPHQILCKTSIHGKEAFIPLHEASLQSIDRKKKIVYTQLPEGLLDVYLS